jgi:hypothetical protein
VLMHMHQLQCIWFCDLDADKIQEVLS